VFGFNKVQRLILQLLTLLFHHL